MGDTESGPPDDDETNGRSVVSSSAEFSGRRSGEVDRIPSQLPTRRNNGFVGNYHQVYDGRYA